MSRLLLHSCNANATKLLRGHPSVGGGYFWHLLGTDRLVQFCPWCGVPLELARLMPDTALAYETWAREALALVAAAARVRDAGDLPRIELAAKGFRPREPVPPTQPPHDLLPECVLVSAPADATVDAELHIDAVNSTGEPLLRVAAKLEAAAELTRAMLASGMTERVCATCGTTMFVRSPRERCPDCEAKS